MSPAPRAQSPARRRPRTSPNGIELSPSVSSFSPSTFISMFSASCVHDMPTNSRLRGCAQFAHMMPHQLYAWARRVSTPSPLHHAA
eukprot:918415-Alexandrium_andersonii.AAC.1